ncbi:MAG: hypothetical protein R6V19_16985 [Armatimonadota bacterium]
MMATPHMLTGAVIGSTMPRRPWLALPLAFASHFVLDVVPHVDSHTYFGVAEGGPTVPEAAIGIADFVLGWVVVVVLMRAHPWRATIWWAAFFGIAIDVVYLIPPLGTWLRMWGPTAWLDSFHHGIQPRLTPDQWLLGFGTQVVVIVAAVWVLVRQRAHQTAQEKSPDS